MRELHLLVGYALIVECLKDGGSKGKGIPKAP